MVTVRGESWIPLAQSPFNKSLAFFKISRPPPTDVSSFTKDSQCCLNMNIIVLHNVYRTHVYLRNLTAKLAQLESKQEHVAVWLMETRSSTETSIFWKFGVQRLGYWGGDGFHWDGGRVGWHGGAWVRCLLLYCLVYIMWARRCIYCAMTSPSPTCRHCQLREMCRGGGVGGITGASRLLLTNKYS